MTKLVTSDWSPVRASAPPKIVAGPASNELRLHLHVYPNAKTDSTEHAVAAAMVVKIRLARFGRKNAPFYNIVVAHAR